MKGDRMALVGFVLDRRCRPVPHALLDLWHANADGEYDNVGYRLRGHQFSDAEGRFLFETIVPGLYPGRTRHFHLQVQAPGQDILTTQLYFPGEPYNDSDRIFDAALLMDMKQDPTTKVGRYDFVLDMG
jgi:protocatechuate 3,4-dioxygenase beta subunit